MRAWLVLVLLVGTVVGAQAAPKIEFSGNGRIPSSELLAAIEDPFDANGQLVEATLERDLLLISAYYWDRGYARVQVGKPVITPAAVRIPITENERFTLGAIAVTGASVRPGDLRLRAGDVFSRRAVAAERERIGRYHQERGYAFVNVLPVTNVDRDRKTIAITFEVERGTQARIERVDVACPALPAAARATAIGSGDLFDIAQLDATQRALARAAGVAVDDIAVSTQRGSTGAQVVVRFACP